MTTFTTKPVLEDFAPEQAVEPAALREIGRQQRLDSPGFMRLVGDAVGSEWAGAWMYRQAQASGFERDYGFRLTANSLAALGDGIPDDLLDGFTDAVSLDHATRIREQLLEVAASRERLGKAGFKGAALRFGAMVLDPVAIAATVATGGIAGEAVYGAKLSRLQRFIRGGFVAAGTEGALQGYLASQDPERDADDVLWAAASAFAIGGGLNALRRMSPEVERAQVSLRKQIELSELQGAGLDLSPDGKLYFREQLDPAAKRAVVDKLLDGLDLPDDELAALRALDPDVALGTVAERKFALGHAGGQFLDLDFSSMLPPPKDAGLISRLRYSMGGMLVRSESPLARKLGAMLAQNSVPNAAGDPVTFSASEWVGLLSHRMGARRARVVNNAFDQWADARGVTAFGRDAARLEFGEEVWRAVHRPRGEYPAPPQVHTVADLFREEHRRLLELLQRYRARGFESVPVDETYMMRVHSQAKIDRAVSTFGERAVVTMLRNAILRRSEGLTEDQAGHLAQVYLRRVRKLKETHLELGRMFDGDQGDLLAKVLREELPGLDDAKVEDILYGVGARRTDAGMPARAKHRVFMDETYAMDVLDGDGKLVGRLGVEDLLETNAELLMHLYTRQALGHAAMAKVFQGAAKTPDDVVATFDALLERVGAELRASGANEEKIGAEFARLDVLHRAVVGLPLEPDTRTARALRALRSYQFVSKMGQMVYAQIPEIAIAMSEVGWRSMLKRMPALRQLFKRMRGGELADPVYREVEAVLGVGTDWMRGHIVNRLDPNEAVLELYRGGRVDQMLNKGQRVTSALSGQTALYIGQQRWAAAAAVQQWADIARAGRLPSKMRLAAMGLSEADAQRIVASIREHASMEPGLFGRRLHQLNLESWHDAEAASKLAFALDKWTRRVIQTHDIGQLSAWMTKPVARTIIQFRSFALVAWENHLLFGLRMHDFNAFLGFAMSMFLGGLSYGMMTYAQSVGMADREKFLNERLTPRRIAIAAFQRGGHSSILPPLVDSTAYMLEEQGPFSYARTTGLSGNAFFGNPTVDFFNSLMRASRGAVGAAKSDEEPFSRADFNAFRKLLPWQNLHGIQNVLNAVGSEFPEED